MDERRQKKKLQERVVSSDLWDTYVRTVAHAYVNVFTIRKHAQIGPHPFTFGTSRTSGYFLFISVFFFFFSSVFFDDIFFRNDRNLGCIVRKLLMCLSRNKTSHIFRVHGHIIITRPEKGHTMSDSDLLRMIRNGTRKKKKMKFLSTYFWYLHSSSCTDVNPFYNLFALSSFALSPNDYRHPMKEISLTISPSKPSISNSVLHFFCTHSVIAFYTYLTCPSRSAENKSSICTRMSVRWQVSLHSIYLLKQNQHQ